MLGKAPRCGSDTKDWQDRIHLLPSPSMTRSFSLRCFVTFVIFLHDRSCHSGRPPVRLMPPLAPTQIITLLTLNHTSKLTHSISLISSSILGLFKLYFITHTPSEMSNNTRVTEAPCFLFRERSILLENLLYAYAEKACR